MKYTNHIYNFYKKQRLNEGFTDEGRPDLKYYAFDWDDNIMYMPTKIIVMSQNEEEVPMSTEDFAEHRHQIGKEPFNYKGTTIVGFAPEPFRNFTEPGNKQFIIDAMIAPLGPAWNDFVECINGGSIFAIITARGHNPEVLKEAVRNLIISNHSGINSKSVIEHLEKYEQLMDGTTVNESIELNYSGKELIDSYLERCSFEPVTFNAGSASSPEEGKKIAFRKFITHCREMAKSLIEAILEKEPGVKLSDLVPKLKDDVSNNEISQDINDFVMSHMSLGFSDDDERNIESLDDMLKQEYPEKPASLYLTKGGEKKKY